ncbi:pilin [Neisseriaceae bacterium TC5R-5]|nr:pilin [Neisseriaceae bacterium TC5R-5]
MTEGLGLADTAKLAVSENASNGINLNNSYTSPANAKNVSSISITQATGTITITFNSNVAPAASNTLTLIPYTQASGGTATALTGTATTSTIPTTPILWQCSSASSTLKVSGSTQGTMLSSNVPQECR